MRVFLHLMVIALGSSVALAASSLLDKIKDDPDLSQVHQTFLFFYGLRIHKVEIESI